MRKTFTKIFAFLITLFLLFISFLVVSCKSGGVVIIDSNSGATEYVECEDVVGEQPAFAFQRRGFRYKVPENMYEDDATAYQFRYDNLIIDKNSDYWNSSMIIAIRHQEVGKNYRVIDFAQVDQTLMKQSINPVYLGNWKPEGLDEKNIEYAAYQFYYHYDRKTTIYQQSVYLKCDDTIYIVSLSSPYKSILEHEKSQKFWKSIRVD